MPLPFFYQEDIDAATIEVVLDADTSKHIVQVLRMQNTGRLQLTDGKGNLFTAEIIDHNRKKCTVKILSSAFHAPSSKKVTIAISLVKNAHRFEWFLEKAAEIGASEIVPLLCSRTEKQHFRAERMNGILVSAMLQSQQTWLPVIHEPVRYSAYVRSVAEEEPVKKFIAYCGEEEARTQLSSCQISGSSVILIGPEGDFSIDEIELALQNNFVPVGLGNTRLRTETAGVVAVTILCLT